MMTDTFDWTAVARAWDRQREHVSRISAPMTDELFEQLRLQPGERVLELGAGSGELALALAARVSPGGSVIATDVAPGMVSLLERTLAGVDGVRVERLDARDTGLPDGWVDVVVFRMGLMFVQEPAVALRECHRVLADRGRIGLAVWAAPQHNPWLACAGMSAMMHGVVSGGPPTGPGGVFSLADPAGLEHLVRGAGFTDVVLTDVETSARFADADEHFDIVTSLAGPLSVALAAATDADRDAVRRTTAEAVERFRTPDGLELPGRAVVCTARAT